MANNSAIDTIVIVQPPDPLDLWETPPFEPRIVERFFNKLKNSRSVATGYDKLASSFLGLVIRLWRFVYST